MIPTSRRTLVTLGAFVLAIWPAFMVQAALLLLLTSLQGNASPWAVVAKELAGMALPILASLVLARWLGKRLTGAPLEGTPSLRRRPIPWLWGSIAVLYGLTWALGAPAVQTALVQQELAEYKKLEPDDAARREDWRRYPYMRVVVCVPLVPGMLATYHEYQLAGLNGWGGWRVHVWYGSGVKEVANSARWVS